MENKNFNTGIYQIVNLVNGKRYIGSSVNIKNRFNSHLSMIRRLNHANKHIQKSFNKYGEKNFKFEILLYCSKEDLLFYEQKFINFYKKEDLYNIALVDENGKIHKIKKYILLSIYDSPVFTKQIFDFISDKKIKKQDALREIIKLGFEKYKEHKK